MIATIPKPRLKIYLAIPGDELNPRGYKPSVVCCWEWPVKYWYFDYVDIKKLIEELISLNGEEEVLREIGIIREPERCDCG